MMQYIVFGFIFGGAVVYVKDFLKRRNNGKFRNYNPYTDRFIHR